MICDHVQKICSVRIFSQKKEKFFCSSSSLRIFFSLWTINVSRRCLIIKSASHWRGLIYVYSCACIFSLAFFFLIFQKKEKFFCSSTKKKLTQKRVKQNRSRSNKFAYNLFNYLHLLVYFNYFDYLSTLFNQLNLYYEASRNY